MRDGVDIVEFVAVEIPVVNKFLGELLVVGLNFGNGGTEDGEIAGHASGLAIFVENEPIGMLLHDIGDDVFAAAVAELAVLDGEGKPPELDFDALLVKVVDHLRMESPGKVSLRGSQSP